MNLRLLFALAVESKSKSTKLVEINWAQISFKKFYIITETQQFCIEVYFDTPKMLYF